MFKPCWLSWDSDCIYKDCSLHFRTCKSLEEWVE